jgi:hypothetical protein
MSTSQEKLARLREKMKKNAPKGGSSDKARYPFWDTPAGKDCTIRFLPDADPDNAYFWRELIQFRWTFDDPENAGQKIKITMPSVETWDGKYSCPVMKEISPLYRGSEEDKKIAGRHWGKKSALMQGFVREGAFNEADAPENPIRIFTVNREIFDIIYDRVLEEKQNLMLPGYPADYEEGLDFIVKVKKNGQWNDFGSSQFASNLSPLTEDELAAIDQYGLFNLDERMPKRPSDDAIALQVEMLHASLEGEPWNPDWEEHWKPWRDNGGTSNDDNNNDEDVKASAKSKVASIKARTKQAEKEEPSEDVTEDVAEDVTEDVTEQTDTQDVDTSSKEEPKKTNAKELLARLKKQKS